MHCVKVCGGLSGADFFQRFAGIDHRFNAVPHGSNHYYILLKSLIVSHRAVPRYDNRVLVNGRQCRLTKLNHPVNGAATADIDKRIARVIENIPKVHSVLPVKEYGSVAVGMGRGEVQDFDFATVEVQ